MNDNIKISEYTYDLPADKIALHPLEQRDQSKLLFYNSGSITHQKFSQIPDFLTVNTLLVLNNTKVIPARLLFRKPSGAAIEIFLLNPVSPSPLVQQAMAATESSTWKCTIGNMKKWSSGTLDLKAGDETISAELIDREQALVKFTWTGHSTFAEMIEAIGKTPLPPYLKREVDEIDKGRYQTVYAMHDGAVAAPTAGLHLTDTVLNQLKEKDILPAWVTLHVGAGTFMPVKSENATDHNMHEEQIVINRDLLTQLLTKRTIVAVGTTSLRVLESIYWFGCKLEADPSADFIVTQMDPYGKVKQIEVQKSLTNVLNRMDGQELSGRTSIFIYPGYSFHLCDALITNFHQPGSTLILLVAAFIGSDWQNVYREALENGYRFLSFGDSSLLIPSGSRVSS